MDNLTFLGIKENIFAPDILQGIDMRSLTLFSNYYQEYYQEKFVDLTFVIIQDKTLLGYVICYALDHKLCYPNEGVNIRLLVDCPKKKNKVYMQVIEHLGALAKQHVCSGIVIKDAFQDGDLSTLGDILFNQKYQAKLTFEMPIDYENFTDDLYRKTLRKSYKSLVNWGQKNLNIGYVNKENQNFEAFDAFKAFHLKISGRQTRSDDSWLLQYEMLIQGYGDLILAYYNDTLVAGSLFADYDDTSIYFTGVYERDLFEFGLSHYLLYHGICRSYERGNSKKFSLGYFDTDIQDSKFYNIQFFKKGFCKNLAPIILWSKEVIQ